MDHDPAHDPAREAAREAALGLYDGLLVVLRGLRRNRIGNGLSPSENLALSRIDSDGPITATELAGSEGVSAQTVAALVGALRAHGLVVRRRDEQDARRVLLDVSEEGRATVESNRAARGAQLEELMRAELTPEEIAHLAAAVPLLRRLATALVTTAAR